MAGGHKRRLLAVTPLLLIAQTLLLPVFLVLFLGSGQADLVQIGPFLHAFLFLIVIPLALAWTTQAWGRRHRAGIVVSDACGTLMVPLMSATLLVVVGSQVPKLNGNVRQIASVIPFYIAFLIVMPLAGWAVATMLRLDVPGTRAIASPEPPAIRWSSCPWPWRYPAAWPSPWSSSSPKPWSKSSAWSPTYDSSHACSHVVNRGPTNLDIMGPNQIDRLTRTSTRYLSSQARHGC